MSREMNQEKDQADIQSLQTNIIKGSEKNETTQNQRR